MAATGAAAWIVGALLAYRPLVILAAAVIAALVGAVAFLAWRPQVELERRFSPPAVVVGEPAVALLEVRNTAGRRSPPLSVVDRIAASDIRLAVRSTAAGRSSLVRYDLPTGRRGRVELGPLEVERSDPLGLLRRAHGHGGAAVLWVRPRVWPMAALAAGAVVDLEGQVSETAPAGSLTFSSLREYVPGDDRRLIHWRSSARLGTLLVRHHVDTNEPRVTVVLDARPGVWTGDSFEDGVEVAASICQALAAGNRPVHLHVVGRLPGWAAEIGAATVLDQLAAAELSDSSEPDGLYRALDAQAEGGALAVVSGKMEPAVEAAVAAQNRRFAPVVLCRLDPGRPPAWRKRSHLTVVQGPSAVAVAGAWNRMVAG